MAQKPVKKSGSSSRFVEEGDGLKVITPGSKVRQGSVPAKTKGK